MILTLTVMGNNALRMPSQPHSFSGYAASDTRVRLPFTHGLYPDHDMSTIWSRLQVSAGSWRLAHVLLITQVVLQRLQQATPLQLLRPAERILQHGTCTCAHRQAAPGMTGKVRLWRVWADRIAAGAAW